jgi:3-phosphoshikimate 1-carboxyvinyltransferase
MTALLVRRALEPLEGNVRVPGDKSISHRALMLAAVARGPSRISGLAPGEDVSATLTAMREFGAFARAGGGALTIEGPGIDSWTEPDFEIDCGNSGTTMRLLTGLCARMPYLTTLDGDESLRRRPMDRVAEPLQRMGATVRCHEGRFPPIEIEGGKLVGGEIQLPVASAQVKSAVLLAGLGADGPTAIVEPAPSRDHTERMLAALGVPVRTQSTGGGSRVEIEPFEVRPFDIDVPGDPSSAAYLVAAALLSGSVRVSDVQLNPTRVGVLEVARRMGGNVRWEVTAERMGEPVGWIEAERSELHGVRVAGAEIPAVIDELPLVAVLGSQASGETVIADAVELRVKESDRIAVITEQLGTLGADITERPDGLVVRGPTPLRGASVDPAGDHRIAMALAVAGLVADDDTVVVGYRAVGVSWPGFDKALGALRADVQVVDEP